MSPSSRWRAASLGAVLVLFLAPPVQAAARLEVAGSARNRGTEIELLVDLTNRGDAAAPALTVDAAFLGGRDVARLEEGVPPGATRRLSLRFRSEAERPGVHLADLHLQYPVADGTPSGGSSSQRAYLLVALGANPPPAVALSVPPAGVLDTYGTLQVRLSSADGSPHRVRLRALTPRGVNAVPEAQEVAVPATGVAQAALRLLRAGAPRGSRSGILIVASVLDGSAERTTVATTDIKMAAASPAWAKRLHVPLLVLGTLLVVAALILELAPRRRA